MSRAWRSLRVQLAVLGFLAIYVPVLVLLGVVLVTEHETVEVRDGVEVTDDTVTDRPWWTMWTGLALGPAAAGLAWWWSGRAVGPINRVRSVAEEIESSDLGRRIGLDRGPTEVVSLAAAFDAMLDRLRDGAEIQRQLIEEASHELRTPLAVLAANADVLLAHPEPSVDVYRQGLERSRAAATRLQSTVDELLIAARGRARAIDRQPTDLMILARDVVADAQVLAASKQVTLPLQGPPTARCSLDEPTVKRALTNLLDNAIRHAPEGSSVEIDVEAGDAEARIRVTDHGPGIADHERDHIFERFWRGQGDAEGSGLGLPIAQQIAAAHGGEVRVRSPGPDGDGAEFELSLRR